MAETLRRYEEYPYERSLDTRLLSLRIREKNRTEILLPETIAYPEGGGQAADEGYLLIDGKTLPLLHVFREGGEVWHRVEGEYSFAEDTPVRVEIDGEVRFQRMQLHTAEHMLSGYIFRTHGYPNKGFHIGKGLMTLDPGGVLTEEEIRKAEWAVNRGIMENLRVKAYYPSEDEISCMEYRSKKEIEEAIRIVEVPGFDRCACCGTHVLRTGEIGLVKVIGSEKYKGGMRLTVTAGLAALQLFEEEHTVLRRMQSAWSTPLSGMEETFRKKEEEKRKLEEEILQFRKERAELLYQSLGGEDKVHFFGDTLNAKELRSLADRFVEEGKGERAFFYGGENPYDFVLRTKEKEARELLGALREKGEVRGGGSDFLVSGKISIEGDAEEIIRLALDR